VKRHLFSLAAASWLILFLLLASAFTAQAQSADPVVRAVIFYSPTCPHCAIVIEEDLPPLFEKYGTQLEIIGVDVSQMEGSTLYQAAITHFQIPETRLGVPTLVIDQTVLVGSLEIPEQLPRLIELYLSQGGVDWPGIPGLAEVLAVSTPEQALGHPAAPTGDTSAAPSPIETIPATFPTPDPAQAGPGLALPGTSDMSWQEKFALDPAGNTLSVFVLVGMLGSLSWGFLYFARQDRFFPNVKASWFIPILCLVGLFVAGYLAYVETAQVAAVCGPVGDCNTVQQSEYARLFGILPIGVVGLAGYIMILIAWLGARFGRNGTEHLAALSLLGMAFAGTLFSVYLTFLEPFVIGATCAWCLTSAVLITVLMLLSVEPGKRAYLGYIKNQYK
jgi:uncharacterized membrane protein/thiol-disulfide isomerase/thioredoxin